MSLLLAYVALGTIRPPQRVIHRDMVVVNDTALENGPLVRVRHLVPQAVTGRPRRGLRLHQLLEQGPDMCRAGARGSAEQGCPLLVGPTRSAHWGRDSYRHR